MVDGRLILTNYHVIEDAVDIRLSKTGHFKRWRARVAATGPDVDLATLEVIEDADGFFSDLVPITWAEELAPLAKRLIDDFEERERRRQRKKKRKTGKRRQQRVRRFHFLQSLPLGFGEWKDRFIWNMNFFFVNAFDFVPFENAVLKPVIRSDQKNSPIPEARLKAPANEKTS